MIICCLRPHHSAAADIQYDDVPSSATFLLSHIGICLLLWDNKDTLLSLHVQCVSWCTSINSHKHFKGCPAFKIQFIFNMHLGKKPSSSRDVKLLFSPSNVFCVFNYPVFTLYVELIVLIFMNCPNSSWT